jgi:hypothetical protein
VPGPEARPALETPGEGRPLWLAGALGGLVLAQGALSLALGQDLNFDLLNYHYYDGYAFLHGRTFQDVAPAGSQSFQPPLIHAFHYLGIAHLPPRLFGFLLGCLHGLNLPLVAALGLLLLPRDLPRASVLALLAAFAGSVGPAAISLLGTTFGDNLVSIPALGALLLLLLSASAERPARAAALALAAGVAAGAATGLKLTMSAYHVGLFAAAFVLWPSLRLGGRLGPLCLGSLVGFAPTGGFWDLQLWRRFGNPLFPFANGVFRSSYQSLENFRDTRFMARSAYDLLRPFVDTALGRSERLMEIGMRDVRFALLLAAGLVALLFTTRARTRGATAGPLARPAAAFAAWWASSYLAWALAFYTYRYAALLESTAPLLLLLLVLPLLPARRARLAAALLVVAIVATTRVDSWGRRAWQAPWLGLPVPALGLRPDSLVLMVGQPSAFAIPSFRADSRFVNLTAVERFHAPLAWNPLVEQVVRGHRGPLLLLSNFEFSRAECEERARALGLRATERCDGFRNGALRFRLCELERDEAH